MKKLTTALLLAAFPAVASLSGQSLLLSWNFDEASSGADATIDHGSSPQVDGRFFSSATRTANTPNGFSLGALDVTANAESNVLANKDHLGGKFDNLTSFTLSTWVNLQGTPAENQRMLRAGSGTGFGIRIVDPESGAISASNFGLTLDLGSGGTPLNYTVGADNTWLFLAITFDSSLDSDQVKLYVGDETNFVTLASSVNSTASSTGVLDTHFRAGAHPGVANRGINGYLDDIRVYSGAGDLAFIEDIRLANIPEPGTYALFAGLGAIGLAIYFRRRRK